MTQLALDHIVVSGEHVNLPFQGDRQYLVESRSRPGQHHNVSWEFNEANGKEEFVCTCESFGFRGVCRHVRAVDLWAAGKASVSFEASE